LNYCAVTACLPYKFLKPFIVSRLRYALPAWSGLSTVDLINRIQSTQKRLYRYGYSTQALSFNDLINYCCSIDLFRSRPMLKSNHCLHELLSCYAQRSNSLRSRGHDYVLPACITNLHKQSLIVRLLFYFIQYIVMMSLCHPAVIVWVSHIY